MSNVKALQQVSKMPCRYPKRLYRSRCLLADLAKTHPCSRIHHLKSNNWSFWFPPAILLPRLSRTSCFHQSCQWLVGGVLPSKDISARFVWPIRLFSLFFTLIQGASLLWLSNARRPPHHKPSFSGSMHSSERQSTDSQLV